MVLTRSKYLRNTAKKLITPFVQNVCAQSCIPKRNGIFTLLNSTKNNAI